MSNNKPTLVKPKTVPRVGSTAPKNEGTQKVPQITNPKLCEAMNVFKAEANPENQAAFIQELFKCRLLIPCKAIKKTETEGKNQVQLQFLTLKNKEGDNLFGIFTDWEQIKKQPNNRPTEAVGMPFPEIIRIACGQKEHIKGILINPFEHGILLDGKTIEQMDANFKRAAEQFKARQEAAQSQGAAAPAKAPGTEPLTPAVPKDEEVIIPASSLGITPQSKKEDDILYIGEPLEEPYEITSKLKQYLRSVKSVTAAYFLEIYHSTEHAKPTPLVVLEYKGDKDAKGPIYKEIEDIYNENTEEPLKLTIMTSGEKYARDGIINKKPFYTRKVFGIF